MESSRPRSTRSARNGVMGVLALLSVGLLLAGATGLYRAFSYFAAFFIVVVVGAASIERNDRELDLAPYSRLMIGLAGIFVIGLTGIWLRWQPGTTEYTYVLGLPTSTLLYVVFLWLLPILGAVYYAVVFPSIGSERVVDDIMDEVGKIQRAERYPLSPDPARPSPGTTRLSEEQRSSQSPARPGVDGDGVHASRSSAGGPHREAERTERENEGEGDGR